MAGLYFHIPFCKQACYYCDFHFSTDQSQRKLLLEAMAGELSLQKNYLAGQSIDTIYFGGGTPSLLNRLEIETLLQKVHSQFIVAPDPEITLEANPDDLSPTKLNELKASGINRLSLGVQSFRDEVLKYMNRAHDARAARQCLSAVRESGFSNVSVDLMYGIPDLSHRQWAETVEELLRFSPEHISSYALTIEERTVFGSWQKKGKLKTVDEETEARQFEALMDLLGQSGYRHYEISNFAKPGFLSRHNSSYWKQSHYLGLGPSAHSYNGVSRQFNVRNNSNYIRSLQKEIVPFEREVLTAENKINEYILTSIRTDWGCNLHYLKTTLQDDLIARRGDYLQRLAKQGLVSLDRETLTLSRKGKLLADKIAGDLIVAL